jgi:hypothetical protein
MGASAREHNAEHTSGAARRVASLTDTHASLRGGRHTEIAMTWSTPIVRSARPTGFRRIEDVRAQVCDYALLCFTPKAL